MAALFRVAYLVSPAILSDDIHRYIFDGMVQFSGLNPYAAPPDAFLNGTPILSELAAKVNHGSLVTIYPPVAQIFFRLTAPLGIFGMKLALVLVDLSATICLLGVLKQQGLPQERSLLYAWNPMVIWEIAWSGHIDGLALPFLLLAVMMVGEKSVRGSFLCGVFLALAIWVKLIPAMFLPFFLLEAWRTRLGIPLMGLGGVGVSALCVGLYLPDIGNTLETLALYGATWEFSGFFFGLIRGITGMNGASRAVLTLIFGAWVWFLLLKRKKGHLDFGSALMWCAFGWMLTTPTLHPWYGLYLAVLLPLMGTKNKDGVAAGLLPSYTLTLTPLLGYLVLIRYLSQGVWLQGSLPPFFIVVPPLALFLIHRRWKW